MGELTTEELVSLREALLSWQDHHGQGTMITRSGDRVNLSDLSDKLADEIRRRIKND